MKREICSRFIYSLKIKNILQKYIWYFDFYSRFQGYFYLGPEPHSYNIENNSYKSSEYIKINSALSKNGYVNISNSYMLNLNDKMAEIAFNLGLIVFLKKKKQKQNIMYISAMKLLRIKVIKTQNYLIMPYFLK